MSHNQSDDQQVMHGVWQLLLIVLGIIFGLLVVSQFLTRLLFQHVLNPLLDGWLDREDGAVILLAAGLWAFVAGVILFPLALGQGGFGSAPGDLLAAWLGATLFGALWGVAVGVWILGAWWAEAEKQMPVGYDIIQLLDAPIDIRQPGKVARNYEDGGLPNVPQEDELEQLILGNGRWS